MDRVNPLCYAHNSANAIGDYYHTYNVLKKKKTKTKKKDKTKERRRKKKKIICKQKKHIYRFSVAKMK